MNAQTPSDLSRKLSLPQPVQEQVARALSEIAKAVSMLGSVLQGEGGFAPAASPLLYIQPHSPNGVTVATLVREFLTAKARAGRSDRYLRALKNSLSKFNHGRANKELSELTVHEVEQWMNGQNWQPRTQQGYLSDVRTMLNFAVKRGYLQRNPAAAVELPVVEEPPPSIHTPEQVRTVLEFARTYDPNVCRAMAVRYFAGLRSAEANRIQESEIGEKYIEITAAKSKTRKRRLVRIQPCLRAWLDLGGVLPLGDANNRLRWFSAALLKAHGIAWPHNVTRHSFVSYHLAHWRKASETALDAGHTEQMLFAHYRELVTPEQAKEFWAIVPS